MSQKELTEENIESMVYEIRGQKVMLDFDLARIYGYATKRFNEQVKNNIEKFPEDFMFSLTNDEVESILRCKNCTANTNLRSKKSATNDNLRSQIVTANELSSKRRYNPYAFTEQGIYMLMTVLKGELAVKQSKALIRLFKRMKDYIVESNNLLTSRDILELTNQVHENTKGIESLKRKGAVMDKKLTKVMDNFIDPSTYKHFLILDGQKIEADIAYQTIYSLAESSVYIVDDYISLKTLSLLRGINNNVNIVIFSDNIAKDRVLESDIENFKREYSINISIVPTKQRFHDRFIIIDIKTSKKMIYLCGSSSKDAGKRVTTITRIDTDDLNYLLTDFLIDTGSIE